MGGGRTRADVLASAGGPGDPELPASAGAPGGVDKPGNDVPAPGMPEFGSGSSTIAGASDIRRGPTGTSRVDTA